MVGKRGFNHYNRYCHSVTSSASDTELAPPSFGEIGGIVHLQLGLLYVVHSYFSKQAFLIGRRVVFASAYRLSVLFSYQPADASSTIALVVGWSAIKVSLVLSLLAFRHYGLHCDVELGYWEFMAGYPLSSKVALTKHCQQPL